MPLLNPFALDRVPASFRPFAAKLLAPDNAAGDPADGLIRLLGTLGAKTSAQEARDFALLLRQCLLQSARLDRVSDLFIRPAYPAWYIRAVNDRHRNSAYRRALEALVTPETIVVEAGTGSGLFAMMAARAGARHVYTCEVDPHVAAVARANIDRNGLSGRITLLEIPYEDLRVGAHLPRSADLFLHEFVASELAVPQVAAMFGHLCETILTPQSYILPCGFDTLGMLVGDDWPLDAIRVPALVDGFDVTGINLLRLPAVSIPGPFAIETPLSSVEWLAGFELGSETVVLPSVRRVALQATSAGIATGVLQWIRQTFPDGTVYENRPELACNWQPNFWPFPHPVRIAAGAILELRIECTETEVFIDLAPPEGE